MQSYRKLTERSILCNLLNYMEFFHETGDWLMAGTIAGALDPYFNENNRYYSSAYSFPSQTQRYFQLRDELMEKVQCSMVERLGPEKSTDLVYIPQDTYSEAALDAAHYLSQALQFYPTVPQETAVLFPSVLRPDGPIQETLRAGEFQPSTIALLDQIQEDLLDAGFLKLQDGELFLNTTYD